LSFLEMISANLPDMSKGIISFWFKNAVKNGPSEPWDAVSYPPPVNPYAGIPPSDANSPDVFNFWNPYGEPIDILAAQSPPPIISPLIPVGAIGLPAFQEGTFTPTEIPPVLPHDHFDFLLTFGDPNLSFDYRNWVAKKISTMDGVLEAGGFGVLIPFDERPIPYNPYWKTWPGNSPKAGQPLGNEGLLPCVGIRLDDDFNPRIGVIPQSFIGVDGKKNLRIYLQTNTKANYKGYMFVQKTAKTLMMEYSRNYATPEQITAGEPGTWDYFGPFWAGWEFEYEDQSNKLMNQWPEFFMIQGPEVQDGWNHVLFSFDISGSVSATQDADPTPNIVQTPGEEKYWDPPYSSGCTTNCKAWLALNDHNFPNLQNPFPIPKFGIAASAAGALVGGGSVMWGGQSIYAFTLQQLKLGPNEIVPQNVFATSPKGIPCKGLHWAYASVLKDYTGGVFWAKQGTAEGDGIPTLYRGAGGGLVPVHNGRGTPPELTTPNPFNLSKPTYQGISFSIPTAGHAIGIPASAHHVDHIMGCEMAELQIWSGKTLDTSIVSNRRLFITANGKPENMKKAEAALGRPDIQLHGSSNWKAGKNTGRFGKTSDGDVIPSGQFKRTAKIERYKPDPQVGK
jgi:hypothetical protein